jgi:sulfatase maturation enzyme AslB (radical SAM superfamily)
MCDVGTKTTETNFAQNLIGTHPINMPLELIMKIIDDIHDFYPSAKLGYAFTEPLVYPFLGPSLLYAQEKNVETAITTNALTLVQKAKLITEANVENLFISLDGPESIHNEIRGHPKSFQKAIAGIEKILSLNPAQKISIFCVITEWNIGYLKDFADYFNDFPIKELGFMHTNFTPQSIADYHNTIWHNKYPATTSNVEEVNIDNFDIAVLWEEINEIKNDTYPFPIIFSPEIASEDKLRSFYHEPNKMIGKSAMMSFQIL